ncbi:hypothetical protein [Actinocorallia libanotica]|uniref:Uncharacterized protein n=1 Tax=Actinocorallia libanotica TaxID=46162 RepID=A0ABN1QVG9_9ACTN
MSDPDRWKSLPEPIRLEDTTASQPVLEHTEPLPDQKEIDREWAVRWYG